MNIRAHSRLVILGILTMCAMAGSQTTQPATKPTFSDEQLRNGAEKTYVNFNQAWRAGTETDRVQIASRYWTDEIKSLKPIRVYSHRANIVVVQREQEGIEEGKYFYLNISSYLPESGVDEFVYTPNPRNGGRYTTGAGVWDYKRTREQ